MFSHPATELRQGVRQFLEQWVLEGLLYQGVVSGFKFLGQGLLRLQRGGVQTSLLWILLGTVLIYVLLTP